MAVTIQGSNQIVKQVVNASYSTDTATSSTTPVASGLSASITPSATANKVLVTINVSAVQAATGNGVNLYIARNGTSILTFSIITGYTTSGSIIGTNTVAYLDSPSTTSATTYALYFASNSGGSVNIQRNNSPSFITLQEISGA